MISTVQLLRYLSDAPLRRRVTAATNKVEAFNGFSQLIGFGNGGVITDNDPVEQEKTAKFNALLANAVICHNALDIAEIVRQLQEEDREAAGVLHRDPLRVQAPDGTVTPSGAVVLDRTQDHSGAAVLRSRSVVTVAGRSGGQRDGGGERRSTGDGNSDTRDVTGNRGTQKPPQPTPATPPGLPRTRRGVPGDGRRAVRG
ncbi:Tn3 family transposase [Streptomyces decoyicus]|uniref:Tn3 family transposase n=1 Tax=Streptomyces decoyicus TaxID=249567 RepID=UPI003F4C1753